MKVFNLLYLVFVLSCVDSTDVRVDPLVLIDQGLVRGERSSNGEYSSFLGIPYAQVDAENPFGFSLEHPGFGDSVFNAYNGTIACPQMQEEGTLDCLRLNIYIPTKASSKNTLPVLVWIHGGGFMYGKGGSYNGPNLINQDIVLVTINYRLGAYGFMCLDHPEVPGNQGLRDQLRALRWVKQNIAAFGGNPNDVTIAGQSAGSISLEYHFFSPNEKLFNKIIMQSGVGATDVGKFVASDNLAAIKLSEHLGFNTSDTKEALQFLANTSPNLIVAATDELGFVFRPCKEKPFAGVEIFIENGPYSMSNSNKIRDTPILIGITFKESGGWQEQMANTEMLHIELDECFDFEEEELKKAATIVRHFYIGDEADNEVIDSQLGYFRSDFEYNYQVERTVARFINENAGNIYQYVFNYNNASHSGELKYLFAADYDTFTDEEKLISDRLTILWSNFIKQGTPQPENSDILPFTWVPVNEESRPYLSIDTELTLEHRFRRQSMAFWELFYNAYGQYNKLA